MVPARGSLASGSFAERSRPAATATADEVEAEVRVEEKVGTVLGVIVALGAYALMAWSIVEHFVVTPFL